MHGHCESYGGRWAAGRHRHRRFAGGGFGGRHGGGMNPDDLRAGRMLAQGDLRLVALALIAQAPRHGYEIIKLVEEKTADWYSPSPGIVYPTLTYLEEAGYVTGSSEGSKKLYTITDEGRAFLKERADTVEDVRSRMAAWWGPGLTPELRDLVDEVRHIGQTLFSEAAGGGLRDGDKLRRVREVVARAGKDIESIFRGEPASRDDMM